MKAYVLDHGQKNSMKMSTYFRCLRQYKLGQLGLARTLSVKAINLQSFQKHGSLWLP